MAKIEMGKTYKTRNGDAVRVLCVDLKADNYPVVAVIIDKYGDEVVTKYTAEGHYYVDTSSHGNNLVEHSPWDDVAVDTKIYVQMGGDERWEPRYFASYSGGKVLAWDDGKTSFTANNRKCLWNFAKLAE